MGKKVCVRKMFSAFTAGLEAIRLCAGGGSCSWDCGAHGGHETAEVRDVRRTAGGRGLRGAGGQEKEWIGCLLDDLRAFGINADRWTTAAQDEEEWRETAQDFMAKWIAAKKVRATGLRHAVVCPNVTGRTKERIA